MGWVVFVFFFGGGGGVFFFGLKNRVILVGDVYIIYIVDVLGMGLVR